MPSEVEVRCEIERLAALCEAEDVCRDDGQWNGAYMAMMALSWTLGDQEGPPSGRVRRYDVSPAATTL
jgi:hypothetical protein